MNNSISASESQNPSIIKKRDIRRIYPLVFMTRSDGPYNPEIPIENQDCKFTRRSTSFTKANTLEFILSGIKDGYLPIVVPGHPKNAARITVIDIDNGGDKALNTVVEMLGLNEDDFVITKSRRKNGGHLWVRPLEGDAIGTSQKWEIPDGSGEIIWDRHGVVLWNPTKKLCKFLERVKRNDVREIDISPLIDSKPIKNIHEAGKFETRKHRNIPRAEDCPAEIEKRIDAELLDGISKKIRHKVRESLRILGASEKGRNRNDTLFYVTLCMAEQYGEHKSCRRIFNALDTVAKWKGLSESETESTMKSGWDKGLVSREAMKAEGKRIRSVDRLLDGSERSRKLELEEFALNTCQNFDGTRLYDPHGKNWYGFQKNIGWSFGPDTHSLISNDAASLIVDGYRQGILRSGIRQASVVTAWQSHLKIERDQDGQLPFDRNPDLIGMSDGKVIDVANEGKVRAIRKEDYILHRTAIVMAEKRNKHSAKLFNDFLTRKFAAYAPPYVQDCVDWYKALLLFTLLQRHTPQDWIPFLYDNVGQTGKSTEFGLLSHIAGIGPSNLGWTPNVRNIRGGFKESHEEWLMGARGKSGMIVPEMPKDGGLNVEIIKMFSSENDRSITAAEKGGSSESFETNVSLWMAGNSVPKTKGDGGLFRRLFIIEHKQIPAKDKDYDIGKKLKACAPDVFYEIVMAGKEALKNPEFLLNPPKVLVERSDSLLYIDDIYMRWAKECLVKVDSKKEKFISRLELERRFAKDMKARSIQDTRLDILKLRSALERLGFKPVERYADGKMKRKKIEGDLMTGIWNAEWKQS